MQCLAFAVALSPDQTRTTVDALTSCWRGPRRESFRDARRRAGIVREAVWLQSAPDGALAIVYLEADDLDAAFAIWASSAEPFDTWFRAHAHHVHGVAGDDAFRAPELVLDFDTGRTD